MHPFSTDRRRGPRTSARSSDPAGHIATNESLVGRRGQALWCDPDDDAAEPAWYDITIVTHRPGNRVKYNFVMHFDDGTVEKVQLPDVEGTVVLGDEVVDRCTCERCACCGGEGVALPVRERR